MWSVVEHQLFEVWWSILYYYVNVQHQAQSFTLSPLCTFLHTRVYGNEYRESGPTIAHENRFLVGYRLSQLLAAR